MTTQAAASTTDGKALAEQEAALAAYAGEDRVISASEMREQIKNQPRNRVHFFSRLPGLDKLTDGFQGGELIALSGPTKNGKTLLAQTLDREIRGAGNQ